MKLSLIGSHINNSIKMELWIRILARFYLQLSCVGLFHDIVANIAGTVVNVLLSLLETPYSQMITCA